MVRHDDPSTERRGPDERADLVDHADELVAERVLEPRVGHESVNRCGSDPWIVAARWTRMMASFG